MVTSAIKYLSGLSVTLLFLAPALSATLENAAVIKIVGRVVEDPCVISPQQQAVQFTCYQAGEMHSRNVSYQTVSDGATVNVGVADLSMKYLTPERKLAILEVNYR